MVFARKPHHASRSLTLVEVVVALALMAVIMLAFGSLATTSLRSSTDSRPSLVAQAAVSRLVEIMRTGKITVESPPAGDSIYESHFLNYISNGSNYQVTLNGVVYAAPHLNVPATYATAYNDPFAQLAQSFRNGTMGRPSDAPNQPLRVRFLDEGEYQTMWGLPANPAAAFDLDLDGALTVGVNTSYRAFPVYVELRWRPPGGGPDRITQLKAVLAPPTVLDPTR